MHGSETPRGKPVALKTDRAVYRSCERELPRRKAVASIVNSEQALKRIGHLLAIPMKVRRIRTDNYTK